MRFVLPRKFEQLRIQFHRYTLVYEKNEALIRQMRARIFISAWSKTRETVWSDNNESELGLIT